MRTRLARGRGSIAIVALTVVALLLAQVSVAMAAFGPADAATPCHDMPGMADAMAPASDDGGETGRLPTPHCPMMQGTMCLALLALPAPATEAAPPVLPSVPHLWPPGASLPPQVVPPPQRPPNRL